jgi:hypothetical protein
MVVDEGDIAITPILRVVLSHPTLAHIEYHNARRNGREK